MEPILQHLYQLLGLKSNGNIGQLATQSFLLLVAGCIAYYLTGIIVSLLLRLFLPLGLKKNNRLRKPLALWGSLAIGYFLVVLFLDHLFILIPHFTKIFSLLKIVASSWLLYDVVGLVVDIFKKKKEGKGISQNLHQDLLPLLDTGVRVFILVIGGLSCLAKLGIDTKALLASASVCSIGLALATQDAARNIFSSIIIFLDKPFQKGDSIVAGNIAGKVEEIGLRATRLITPQNGLLYVPNTLLSNGHIENKGHAPLPAQITLAADTPVKKLTVLIKALESGLAADPHTQAQPTIRLESLVKAGIVLHCNWQLTPHAAAATAEHRHRLLLWLLQQIEQHNITVVPT